MTDKFSPATLVLIVFLLLLGPYIKVHLNASAELGIARKLLADNQPDKAVPHFERAIQWYLPLSGMADEAAAGLWRIGESREQEGHLEDALAAFRLLRGAFYSARSFYTPGTQWIDRANEKIATLMARLPPAAPAEAAQSFDQRKREALRVLTQDKSPHAEWAFLAVAGFFGWVAAAFLFIFRAITPDGRWQPRPALTWVFVFALFYGAWLVGMFRT